jgi:hypothetical protein
LGALEEQEDVELEMPGRRCRQSPNSFRTSWQLCSISGIEWDKDMAGTVDGGRLGGTMNNYYVQQALPVD